MTSEENSSKKFVTCDLCGVDSEMPNIDTWFTRCGNLKCTARGVLLLGEPTKNIRYIRYACICQDAIKYGWAYPNEAVFNCDCKREHTISESVAEIRNKQVVYAAHPKVASSQEFNEIKEKLRKSEKEVELLLKDIKEFELQKKMVKKMIPQLNEWGAQIDAAQLKVEERLENLSKMEERLKKSEEEVEKLRKQANEDKENKKGIEIKVLLKINKSSVNREEGQTAAFCEHADQIEKLRKQLEDQQKSRMTAEEKLGIALQELEKTKNENLENKLKNKFLEQMLEEKKMEVKENMDLFRQLLLKRERTSSRNEEEPRQKHQKQTA